MKKVVIIGAGASGMMAAYAAALSGAQVFLLEKNEKPGKKLYITGKGRCNVTNDCDAETFFASVCTNSRFLYSSYKRFDNRDLMKLIEQGGCRLKTERGCRVFPVSDHASDITKALIELLGSKGVRPLLNTRVTEIKRNDSGGFTVYAVQNENRKGVFVCDSIIICTGGLSYPSTGSTGDGYTFAEAFGHDIVTCTPSLVSLVTADRTGIPAGTGLRNISVTLKENGKKKPLFSDIGEMNFTENGVSGPLILSASAYLGDINPGKYTVTVDLKPGLDEQMLEKRILRDFEASSGSPVRESLHALLIGALIEPVLRSAGIEPSKKTGEVTKHERRELVRVIKNTDLPIAGKGGFSEAVVTKGGISLDKIDPSTMESRLCPGLYFAGEVLDLDAFTGGFNLQIAWTTGYTAGASAGSAHKEGE